MFNIVNVCSNIESTVLQNENVLSHFIPDIVKNCEVLYHCFSYQSRLSCFLMNNSLLALFFSLFSVRASFAKNWQKHDLQYKAMSKQQLFYILHPFCQFRVNVSKICCQASFTFLWQIEKQLIFAKSRQMRLFIIIFHQILSFEVFQTTSSHFLQTMLN